MRSSLRELPWLVALVGLGVPLVGSDFIVWPLTAVWLLILGLIRVVGRSRLPPDRMFRRALAVGLLPVLFLLGWEGGWWLIPADLAYLVIEVRASSEDVAGPTAGDSAIDLT